MATIISQLEVSLGDIMSLPGSSQYAESVESYFSIQESRIKPACILRPNTTAEAATVVSALAGLYERCKGDGSAVVKFGIRSGGHACGAGTTNQEDRVTIDLRQLNSISVSEDGKTAKVGTGATWGQVYRALDPLGLSVPGGRQSPVGVGGLTLGGGLSHFSGQVGLVCDNVLEYEVVLASGSITRVSEEQNTDLFWALKSGGNNFGLVTHFTFRTVSQDKVYGGTLIHPLQTKDEQLEAFFHFVNDPDISPNDSIVHSYGFDAEKGSACVNSLVHTSTEPSKVTAFAAFTNIEPIYMNTLKDVTLTELCVEQDAYNQNGLGELMMASTCYLDHELLRNTYDLWLESQEEIKDVPGIRWSLCFQPISPKVVAASPFLQDVLGVTVSSVSSVRPIVIHQLVSTWAKHEDTIRVEAAALKLMDIIDNMAKSKGLSTGYRYLNYTDPSQKDVFGDDSSRGQTRLRMLQEVGKRYDPIGLFQYSAIGGHKLFKI